MSRRRSCSTRPEPATRRRRAGAALRLLLLVLIEAACVWALVVLSRLPSYHVEWHDLVGWLRRSPIEDALPALLVRIFLVPAIWCLFTTLLYCVASLSGVPALVRGTRWLALPFVRSVVDRALAVTVSASIVVGASGGVARAATGPSGPPLVRPPAAVVVVGDRQLAPSGGEVHRELQQGQTLWDLAASRLAEVLGRPVGGLRSVEINPYYRAVVQANGTRTPTAGDMVLLPAPAAVTASAASTGAAWADHEVRPGDSMWTASEQRLAEVSGRDPDAVPDAEVGPYWASVVADNRDGIRSGDPNLIFPGEHLRMRPVPGVDAAADPPSSAPVAAPAPPVREPAPAAPTPATTAVPPTTVASVPAAPAPSARATTGLAAPDSGATPASRRTSVAVPTTRSDPAARTSTSVDATPRQRARAVAVNPWAQRAALAGALGLPLLALGGWLRRLRRGRAAQAARLRSGRQVPLSLDPEAEVIERRAAAIAVDQAEEWVDAALRYLTAVLVEAGVSDPPEVRCVRAGELGLEVLLAEPWPSAPAGWEPADGGNVWRLSSSLGLEELRRRGEGRATFTPALASLGATPEGPLLVDLEGLGVLGVDGDEVRVRAFLAGVALELSTATWAEGATVMVHGLSGFDCLGVDAPDGAALVVEAAGVAGMVADALAAHGSAGAARVHERAEPWYPLVLVLGPDAPLRLVEELTPYARPGSGVVLVAATTAVCEWQLFVGPDGAAVLSPLGLGVHVAGVVDMAEPDGDASAGGDTGASAHAAAAAVSVDQAGLNEEAIDAAKRALVTAEDPDDVAAPTPLVAAPAARLRRQADCDMWVSILRRVPTVTGWPTVPGHNRRKLVEVFVYLAVYGADGAVPGSTVRADCWEPKLDDSTTPPRLVDISADAFHQAMSRLRHQAGQGEAGWHVPVATDGGYQLGPAVGCDWILFRALSQSAAALVRQGRTTEAIAFYQEALDLVEGEPFADVAAGTYAWADSKRLTVAIRGEVFDTARRLAELALPIDPRIALEATRKGHLVIPTQLELFDTALHAAGALGDLGALEQAFAGSCWANEQVDPDGCVSPETLDLYRRLKAKISGRELIGQAAKN